MWEFRLIEMLTSYSWPFIDIRLQCLDDRKPNFLKYLSNIFIYVCGFWNGVGAPNL
jgi:hypothetical protein